jgi:cell division protein FtsN
MKRKNTDTSMCTVRRVLLFCAAFVLFGAATLSLSAQEGTYWEGSVAVSAYGRLPSSGMYAASDAFSLDTKVTVRNVENGKTAEVRIVERLDDPRIFILVSPAAAERLDIAAGDIARAKVRPAVDADGAVTDELARDRAYTPDPDLNPAAEVTGPSEEPAEREPETAMEPAEEAVETAAEEQQAPAEEPEEPEEEPDVEAPNAVEPPVEVTVGEAELQEPQVAEAEEPAEKEAEEPGEGQAQEPSEAGEPFRPVPEQVRTVRTEEDAEVPSGRDTPRVKQPPEDEEGPRVTGMAVFSPAESAAEPAEEIAVPQVRTAEREAPEAEPAAEEPAEEEETPAMADTPVASAPEPLFPSRRDLSWRPTVPQEPAEEREPPRGPAVSLRQVVPEGEGPLLAAGEPAPSPPRGASSLPDMEGVPEEAPERLALAEPELPAEEPERESAPAAAAEPEQPSEPKPIPKDAELTLRPAEERPPEGPVAEPEAPAEEPAEAKAEEAPAAQQPAPEPAKESPAEARAAELEGLLTAQLKEARYYLQVGAYKEEKSAGRLARRLAAEYPVTVYTGEKSGGFPYKVMVGPLSEDESGAVLFAFHNRGYSDAFLRKGPAAK